MDEQRGGNEAEHHEMSEEQERHAIEERKSGSSKILHEVVREEGEEELKRPALSLLFSGFAAGVSISFSLIAEGALKAHLPDAPWAELIINAGYTVGFIVVVLGRLQLFTESTVTPVLPVATRPSLGNLARLLRLWVLVLVANLAGTLMVAWLAYDYVVVPPEIAKAMGELSQMLLEHNWLHTFLLGMPAGFLVASIAWILPNARGSEIWVVSVITYVVAIGGFSHVIAGSAKAWTLWLNGSATLGHAVGGLMLPALFGNIVGGTGLFAVLAHGQVRHELKGKGEGAPQENGKAGEAGSRR